MKTFYYFILVVSFLFTSSSFAQQELTDKQIKSIVDSLANAYLSTNTSSGLVFGIIKNGNSTPLIYTYGYANKSKNENVNSNSMFQIGSITKVFTGTVLAKFVQDGKANLNEPVQKYLPSNVKMPTYDGQQITLEELATHTSGLPRLPTNFMAALKDTNNPYANYTLDDLYSFLNSYKLKYEPGGKHWEYSNLGFGLLGQVLSNISDMTYENLVIENICNVLNMPDTRMTLSSEQNSRRVQGYSTGQPESEWTFTNCTAGGGALFSTIGDMMTWLKFNMGITNNSLSSVLAITEKGYWHNDAQTPLTMGLGWQIYTVTGTNILLYYKDGGAGGCSSIMVFTKDPARGVVVIGNSDSLVDDLGTTLLANLLGTNK